MKDLFLLIIKILLGSAIIIIIEPLIRLKIIPFIFQKAKRITFRNDRPVFDYGTFMRLEQGYMIAENKPKIIRNYPFEDKTEFPLTTSTYSFTNDETTEADQSYLKTSVIPNTLR